jgi:hypothetical protein
VGLVGRLVTVSVVTAGLIAKLVAGVAITGELRVELVASLLVTLPDVLCTVGVKFGLSASGKNIHLGDLKTGWCRV